MKGIGDIQDRQHWAGVDVGMITLDEYGVN
jgi:hypothetical protein